MENKEIILKSKEVKGMEMYKKTPEERIELKKAKKAHKEWLKNKVEPKK